MSDASEEVSRLQPDAESRSYVESSIIMATVRVIAPFVFTYGLYLIFHGADSSGGGFQGGVVVATVFILLGVAFGIDTVREWLDPAAVVAVIGLGLAAFVGIGLAPLAFGGGFLEYEAFGIDHAVTYSIEAVEVFIGVIVAGTITGLVFAIAAGTRGENT